MLPHGEAVEQNSNFNAPKQQDTLSGFSNEINLKNVAGIKKDPSKKIVIENIDEHQADEFRIYYWKGDRYVQFIGNKWEKPGYEGAKNLAIPRSGLMEVGGNAWNPSTLEYESGTGGIKSADVLEKYRVTYYTLGNGNLFFPKTPEAFAFSNFLGTLNVSQAQKDNSLFSIAPILHTPLTLDVYLKRSRSINMFVDSQVEFVPFNIRIAPETERLFKKFWDGIDPNLQKNPYSIATYIRDRAGFKYSIDAPAANLESFLYGTKQGHCEYFATVLTLTLQHF